MCVCVCVCVRVFVYVLYWQVGVGEGRGVGERVVARIVELIHSPMGFVSKTGKTQQRQFTTLTVISTGRTSSTCFPLGACFVCHCARLAAASRLPSVAVGHGARF